MIADTMVIAGRYWYDFVTFAILVAFFFVVMALLFRRSLVGWSMTAAFLTLGLTFGFAMTQPPVKLPPEDVTIAAVVIRIALIAVLGWNIAVLIRMRVHRQTVIVGKEVDLVDDNRGANP